VVGKVFAVYPDTSQVLLLTDKESGVGALLAASRSQGPVRGSGDPLLGLEYISSDVKVEQGEKILTSGQDRIFPKDLPVGTVVQVQPDRRSPFQKISVKPAARLDGLEEVLVLLTRQEFTFRKDADKAPVPVASVTSPKPAAFPTAPKPVASVTPSKPTAPPPPVKPGTPPAIPPVPPKPAAPVTSPKPAASEAPSKPAEPETPQDPGTPDNP
jgi:rod shape-determining protein MreC